MLNALLAKDIRLNSTFEWDFEKSCFFEEHNTLTHESKFILVKELANVILCSFKYVTDRISWMLLARYHNFFVCQLPRKLLHFSDNALDVMLFTNDRVSLFPSCILRFLLLSFYNSILEMACFYRYQKHLGHEVVSVHNFTCVGDKRDAYVILFVHLWINFSSYLGGATVKWWVTTSKALFDWPSFPWKVENVFLLFTIHLFNCTNFPRKTFSNVFQGTSD